MEDESSSNSMDLSKKISQWPPPAPAESDADISRPLPSPGAKGFLSSRPGGGGKSSSRSSKSPTPPPAPHSPKADESPPKFSEGSPSPKLKKRHPIKKGDGADAASESSRSRDKAPPSQRALTSSRKSKKGQAAEPSEDLDVGGDNAISRQPGASSAFMPEVPEEPAAAPPSKPKEEYGSTPANWAGLDSMPPPEAEEPLADMGEVPGVSIKGKKAEKKRKSLLGKMKGKGKDAAYEAKAVLAYYGTIGGGFGTPRVGFAQGQFNTPTWMATQANGNLVVASTFAHEVQLLSARGGPQTVISKFGQLPLHDPQGVAMDGNSMYIADGGNGRVLKLVLERDSSTNPPTEHWVQKAETLAGMLELPQGLAVDENLLFVVCGRMDRVFVLDANKMTRLFSFGHSVTKHSSHDENISALSDPTCIAVYHPPDNGNAQGLFGGRARKLLYITDTEADRIVVFSMDGDFVTQIGQHGKKPGEFIEPLGIAIRQQQVFVAEGGRGLGGRLQVLKPDGTPLLVLPAPTGGRLVGVHWHDSRLYCSEIEAHRLHAFKIVR